MRHSLKLVMFDFDGTLVDSQAGIVAAMAEAFHGAGLPAPQPADVRRIVGLNLVTAIATLVPEAAAGTVAEVAERYRAAFAVLRARPDFDEPLFPGARQALETLDRPEVLLGIATGKNRRGLLHALERHGLSERFVTLKTADDGPGKPHPAILESAMAEHGVEPADTVMVGDTVFDMKMARSARAGAVGVSWGYHDPEDLSRSGAHHIIETFDELEHVLHDLTERT